MVKTAVQTSTSSAAPAAGAAAGARQPRQVHPVKKVLAALASLRLTVALFVLALILVFAGTLAQVDAGIWTVVNKYFRSFYVWMPLQIFFPRSVHVPGGFPFPGGWLIGSVLLVNLLAAHAVRFKLSWKRSGVLLLHAGLIVMMLSEFITGMWAIEGMMTIETRHSSNYVEEREATELAVIDPSDSKTDDVVVIPGSILRQRGMVRSDLLPFDVHVDRYMVNSDLAKQVPAGSPNPATAGAGLAQAAVARPEGNGVSQDQKFDVASAYVTFTRKGTGEALGTYLVSQWLDLEDRPLQQVAVDGKTYQVGLRFKRIYKPYTIQLLEFHHDKYLGTDTPRNFSSKVRLIDPGREEDRETLIYMNHPLRYAGETFYQSGYLPGDRGTILQVVRNPGWLMPYISCAMVVLGMLVHFGSHLVGFLSRRAVS